MVAAPRPAPRPAPAQAAPTARAKSSRGTLIVLLVVTLGLGGLLAAGAWVGGVGLDYLAGGPSVRSFIEKRFGRDARYISIHLQSGYMQVTMITPDNSKVGQRFDGRSARDPEPDGKASPEELAQAFSLDDVDFDSMKKVGDHARRRQPDGTLEYILLGRPSSSPDILWAAHMKVAGEYKRWLYDLEGEPLVDDVRDYLAPKAEWFAKVEKKAGSLRVVMIVLTGSHADLETMAPKSERDTDMVGLDADGVLGVPRPHTNDGDAATLREKVFRLTDVDWKAVNAAVADARKADGDVQSVTLQRDRGQLGISVYVQNKRGASRSINYDAKGKRLASP